MCVPRACFLLLLAVSAAQPTLYAASHATAHRLPSTPVASHHANDAIRHLTFLGRVPAEPAPSAINPPRTARGFSLPSLTIHSVLDLFGQATP